MKVTTIITTATGMLLMTVNPVVAGKGGKCLPCTAELEGHKMCNSNHMTTWIQICKEKCWQTFEDCGRNKKCMEKPGEEPKCVKA